jgi:hypothetical protein
MSVSPHPPPLPPVLLDADDEDVLPPAGALLHAIASGTAKPAMAESKAACLIEESLSGTFLALRQNL